MGMFAIPSRAALSRTRPSATLARAPRIVRNSLADLMDIQQQNHGRKILVDGDNLKAPL